MVQAIWSGDGDWYTATIDGVSAQGHFVVTFDEDGGSEEVRCYHFTRITGGRARVKGGSLPAGPKAAAHYSAEPLHTCAELSATRSTTPRCADGEAPQLLRTSVL